MPIDPLRGLYESEYYRICLQYAPKQLPQLYHYDQRRQLICMEYLEGMKNLKFELISGKTFPKLGEQLTDYLSQCLFMTSDFNLSIAEKMKYMQIFCGNWELCSLTQSVIFQEPYYAHPNNNWTLGLDDLVKDIQSDVRLKHAAVNMLRKFRSSSQALIHADLHSASIMVSEERTVVIDPEFSFFGPMGFDIGKLLSSFTINYLSQPVEKKELKNYLLDLIRQLWLGFKKKFLRLWDQHCFNSSSILSSSSDLTEIRIGSLYIKEFSLDLRDDQEQFMNEVFEDVVHFAGLSLIRRVIGIASNPDMLSISDVNLRAERERKELEVGRLFLLKKNFVKHDIDEIIQTILEVDHRLVSSSHDG